MRDVDIIEEFEKQIANYAGAKYGVAISSGTNAIFLSLLYLKTHNLLKEGDTISIPSRTYMSVPMTLLNLGLKIKFEDNHWSGFYPLKPTNIYDSAVRFTKDMYVYGSLYCLSFQYRKALPIGRGGMILTDDKEVYDWLRCVRFNGRNVDVPQSEDNYTIQGWNMYMMPEQATRGMTLFEIFVNDNKDTGKDIASYKDYPDLSRQGIFK